MKALQAGVQGGLLRALESVGVRRSEAAIEAAAQKYWRVVVSEPAPRNEG
jgi:hypothetical protein